ncbi:hypothetical protein CHH68_01960 [Bacillus velezensis]|nr:hypothetical protein CHH68_01960 [Bacillus velezensis]
MHVKQIHLFKLSKEDFVQTQQSLKHKINLSHSITPDSVNTCAGVDLAYWDQDGEPYGVCSIIVIEADTKEVIEKVHSMGKISMPYVSGFLAFRELPLIQQFEHIFHFMGMSFKGYVLGEGNRPGDILHDHQALSAASSLLKRSDAL